MNCIVIVIIIVVMSIDEYNSVLVYIKCRNADEQGSLLRTHLNKFKCEKQKSFRSYVGYIHQREKFKFGPGLFPCH